MRVRFIRAQDIREGDIVLFGDDVVAELPAWVVAVIPHNGRLEFTFKYRNEDSEKRRGFEKHVCPKKARCLLLRRSPRKVGANAKKVR